jgi:protease-4
MNIFSALWALMKLFWSFLTATRRALANFLLLIILAVVLISIFSDKQESLAPGTVLVLDPAGPLVEEMPAPDPVGVFLRNMGNTPKNTATTKVQDVIDAVRKAAMDSRIEAILIDPKNLAGCDTSKLLEIGKAIRNFKQSGKPVIAQGALFTQGQYLLGSYADKIYVHPLGGVLINGFGAYQTYFKGLLDKARITLHLFRVGDYKTAAEPLVRDSMSDEARISMSSWINALWKAYLYEAAQNRGLTSADIADYATNIHQHLHAAGGDGSRLAVSARLADDVLTADQVKSILAEKIGQHPQNTRYLSFQDYLRVSPLKQPQARENVGIIRARGPIVPGTQPEDKISSRTIAELLRKAREDASIVAVVLRLDSPGGSASASEEIHREIILTKNAGKPVVVSMSSVAASGAYWIATAANSIVAAPTTLTGSIGIFAVIPSLEDAAKEWGITTDGIGTTPFSGLGNPLRSLSTQQSAAIQNFLQNGYDMFIARVAEGRRITPAEAEASAQGRVFTGEEALKRKLVDKLGTLDDAIRVAGELAGLSTVYVKELRRELSPREKFMQSLSSSEQALFQRPGIVGKLLGLAQDKLKFLDAFTDPSHIYVRSLECEATIF